MSQQQIVILTTFWSEKIPKISRPKLFISMVDTKRFCGGESRSEFFLTGNSNANRTENTLPDKSAQAKEPLRLKRQQFVCASTSETLWRDFRGGSSLLAILLLGGNFRLWILNFLSTFLFDLSFFYLCRELNSKKSFFYVKSFFQLTELSSSLKLTNVFSKTWIATIFKLILFTQFSNWVKTFVDLLLNFHRVWQSFLGFAVFHELFVNFRLLVFVSTKKGCNVPWNNLNRSKLCS